MLNKDDLNYQQALAEDNSVFVPSESQCLVWLSAAVLALQEKQPVALTVRIVESAEIQQLNKDYRQKDYATNILSFQYEKPPGVGAEAGEPDYLGDLIISAEVVAREAVEQGKPLEAHWAHMLIHGCLHLYGLDHIEDEAAEEMEALEVKILADLGISNPYKMNTHGDNTPS